MELFNHWLFLLINANHTPAPSLLDMVKLLAELPVILIPACLLMLWFFTRSKGMYSAFSACICALLALGCNFIISTLWYHNRPFADHLGITLIDHVPDSSFPSDHITLIASVGFYLLFDKTYKHVGSALLAVSLLTGWARVYTGVHYPVDIIGAYLVSVCVASFCNRYLTDGIKPIFNFMVKTQGSIIARFSAKQL